MSARLEVIRLLADLFLVSPCAFRQQSCSPTQATNLTSVKVNIVCRMEFYARQKVRGGGNDE